MPNFPSYIIPQKSYLVKVGSADSRFPPGRISEALPAFFPARRESGFFGYTSPGTGARPGSPCRKMTESAALKRYTDLKTAIQAKVCGAPQERGEIRKESLRGNLKGGERISDAGALSPLSCGFLSGFAPRAQRNSTADKTIKRRLVTIHTHHSKSKQRR